MEYDVFVQNVKGESLLKKLTTNFTIGEIGSGRTVGLKEFVGEDDRQLLYCLLWALSSYFVEKMCQFLHCFFQQETLCVAGERKVSCVHNGRCAFSLCRCTD